MVYYEDYIILYGGETEKGITDDNFYRFQIETKSWSILKVSGVKPGFRAYFSMNFFKKNTLIIFGGKTKSQKDPNDYEVTDSLIYIDLKMMNCSNPFIADIGPSPRFGHKAAYNALFTKGNKPYLHCIVGGLDKSYCSMDIYCIKEIELNKTNKWVYVRKNMHNTQKIDGTDEVFETAKKTIIQFKKKLEEANKENIAVNKIYSEYFQTLNKYNKSIQDEKYSSNAKKGSLMSRKLDIEKEKREITGKQRELKDYNNLLNSFCNVQREKYRLLYDIMLEYFSDIDKIDKLFEDVNKRENKRLLFSEVNLDNLTVKRRNFKAVLEGFLDTCSKYSLFEKSIYDDIQNKQNEQKEKFKNMYFILDDKQPLSFKEEVDDSSDSKDLSQNIIK